MGQGVSTCGQGAAPFLNSLAGALLCTSLEKIVLLFIDMTCSPVIPSISKECISFACKKTTKKKQQYQKHSKVFISAVYFSVIGSSIALSHQQTFTALC